MRKSHKRVTVNAIGCGFNCCSGNKAKRGVEFHSTRNASKIRRIVKYGSILMRTTCLGIRFPDSLYLILPCVGYSDQAKKITISAVFNYSTNILTIFISTRFFI